MEKKYVATKTKMLIIGGSAGALNVLLQVLPNIKKELPFPVVIILHRKADVESSLEHLLDTITSLPVKEIEDKEKILPGNIYIVPADYHVLIEKNNMFSLDVSEKVHYCRPSIDVTFESAAAVYPDGLVAVILSGANADGTAGADSIQKAGGKIWVQLPDSASVDYMPQHVIDHLDADLILSPEEMAKVINELL